MLYFRPTSRKLSDLSSVLDEKSVYEALNNSQKRSYENGDDSLVINGTNYYFRMENKFFNTVELVYSGRASEYKKQPE